VAEKRKRQLAAIMFTDIVGYSAMMNTNEQEGITKANRYRQILSELVEQHDGEIIQHYGDGSLSVFSSSVQAVTCAEAIQIELRKEPKIPLRIGIHLGDVVLDGEEIYGDGINIASRVESMGIAGSVLMTERISHDLRSHPDLELTSLGKFQFKNIANSLEVFALVSKDFPIPDKNNISGKFESNTLPTSQSNRKLRFLALGLVALITGWMILQHFSNTSKTTSSNTKERISIAVLPIENLSTNPENASICNGLMQEIIARISAVKDFRVLPRTSVLQVANNNLSIPEIAEELGVKYVLESSLQSSNDQIRINANLIQANDNEVLWNQNFKGDYAQIFDFQAEIAQSVSKELGTTLSPLQTDIIARRPTKNMQAYKEYLKGLEELNLYSELFNRDHLEKAKTHFLNVIKIDKTFAEVYVKIGEIYYSLDDGSGILLDSTLYYANTALSINPNIADAYLLKGDVSYTNGLDSAEDELLKGHKLNPSSPEVNNRLSSYYLYKNQYDKAFRYAQEALLLAPKKSNYYRMVARIYSRCGMEKETYETLSKGIAKTNDKSLLSRVGWADLAFKNDPTQLINQFLAELEKGNKHPLYKFQLGHMYSRIGKYEKAKKFFDFCYAQNEPCASKNEFFRVLYAYTLRELGKKEDSEKYIEDVLKRRTKFLQPESSYYLYNFQALASAHALDGNADSTIYWLEKWKNHGNFDILLFKNAPLYKPIINEPVVQEFVKKEQARIDSMAANILQMRIRG